MILKWDCWARLHNCIFPNPALMNRAWVSFFGCIITASGMDKTFLTLNQPVSGRRGAVHSYQTSGSTRQETEFEGTQRKPLTGNSP